MDNLQMLLLKTVKTFLYLFGSWNFTHENVPTGQEIPPENSPYPVIKLPKYLCATPFSLANSNFSTRFLAIDFT